MGSILIKNGRVIDTSENSADVYIDGGRIVKVGDCSDVTADTVIDASGKYVMPGLVDMHCHLREPGFEHKETIETGARSAAYGGYTSIACKPKTSSGVDEPALRR